MSDVSLFVRKASGLVRAWSVFDAFIYATFSINLITLGLFIFSYCWYFGGSLGTAVVVGGLFTIFEVIVYASLISAMPRAGGDYVWQSRILGGGIGFVLAVTGWWFILWLWVPLYGDMFRHIVLVPILGVLGAKDTALWFAGTQNGAELKSEQVAMFQAKPDGAPAEQQQRAGRGIEERIERSQRLGGAQAVRFRLPPHGAAQVRAAARTAVVGVGAAADVARGVRGGLSQRVRGRDRRALRHLYSL